MDRQQLLTAAPAGNPTTPESASGRVAAPEGPAGSGGPAAARPAYQQLQAIATTGKPIPATAKGAASGGGLAIDLANDSRFEEAIAVHERLIAADPGNAVFHLNYGVTLKQARRVDEAIAAYRRAIDLRPTYALAYSNLGGALEEKGELEAAVAACRHAISLDPELGPAYAGLGGSLMLLNRVDEAFEAFRKALSLDPDNATLLQHYCLKRRLMADWDGIGADLERLHGLLRRGAAPVDPFEMLVMGFGPAEQLACSSAWSGRLGNLPALQPPPSGTRRRALGRHIRVGYLSADFHLHATAALVAELIERHDRTRFEIVAYSYGEDDRSDMRRRLVLAFDRFVDLSGLSDRAAAQRIRDDGVDILVDLKGYTQQARVAVAAARPAPIQVNFLGFPGTMGAGHVDYIIADPFIAPMDQQRFFGEKIVQLPDTYQPNDRRRVIDARAPTRAESGLPEQGFVFCCFNHSYKITPAVFDIWMRLLGAVPGSVLWLLSDNAILERNLRREAEARGIDPQRLVFGEKIGLPEHLARHRLADLFLDNVPVNAHTTASDALWAGLPVLTCAGDSFAGRVAGSLLFAADLPELVTTSLEEYEAEALRLATDPAYLAGLRQRLAERRLTMPLFDIDRFTHHLESAYARMWDLHEAGRLPEAFAVEALPRDTPVPPRVSIAEVNAASDRDFAEAVSRHQAGDLAAAEAAYRAILARDPCHFNSLHHLGIVAQQTGRDALAAELIDDAIAIRPRHALATVNLCRILRKLGRVGDAVRIGRRAVALAATDADAHFALGLALRDEGQPDAAIEALRSACELRPGFVEARVALVEALQGQGRLDEALATLRQAALQ